MTVDTASNGGSSFIEVTRASGFWMDSARAYTVVIDGTTVASVLPGETEKCPVAPGPHELRVCVSYLTSPVLAIDAKAGEATRVFCWPAPERQRRPFWASLYARKRAIALTTDPNHAGQRATRPAWSVAADVAFLLALWLIAALRDFTTYAVVLASIWTARTAAVTWRSSRAPRSWGPRRQRALSSPSKSPAD